MLGQMMLLGSMMLVNAKNPEAMLQRYAIVTLGFALNVANWLICNVHECDWAEITCTMGSTIIDTIELGESNLEGKIPGEIGLLKNLVELNLWSNTKLTGSLPSEIGGMQNLERLDLENNKLTGTLPSEIGRLQNLEELYLAENKFTGTLPSEIASMQNLILMDFSNNKFTGTLSSDFGRMSSLERLYLRKNRFSGSVNVFCTNYTNFDIFYADCIPSNAALACTCCTHCCNNGVCEKV